MVAEAGRGEEYLSYVAESAIEELKREEASRIGVGQLNLSIKTQLEGSFGDIERIMNGDITVVDGYNRYMKRERAIANTAMDIAKEAKMHQMNQDEYMKAVQEGLKASNEAEGIMGVAQAANTMEANKIGILYGMSKSINNLAVERAMEAYDKVTKEARDQKVAEQVIKTNASCISTNEEREANNPFK